MKVFIIGPEGSGKTVFLAMLSRYVATQRADVVLEPVDYIAASYVISALSVLEKGDDWPRSTVQGDLPILNWRFGKIGSKLDEIVTYDAAGQDLREILLSEKLDKLTPMLRHIRAQIDAADVLIYMLDLGNFLNSKDIVLRNENGWLFRTFLTTPAWHKKKRLVILSKADIYADMLEAQTALESSDVQIRKLVKRHLPKEFSNSHLLDVDPSIRYMAVTSVVTQTRIDPDGNPQRLPQSPLSSAGLNDFVEALICYAHSGNKLHKVGRFIPILRAFLYYPVPWATRQMKDPSAKLIVSALVVIIVIACLRMIAVH